MTWRRHANGHWSTGYNTWNSRHFRYVRKQFPSCCGLYIMHSIDVYANVKELVELFKSKEFQDSLWKRHDKEGYIAILPDHNAHWQLLTQAFKTAGWKRGTWTKSRMSNYKLWTYVLRRPAAYKIVRHY